MIDESDVEAQQAIYFDAMYKMRQRAFERFSASVFSAAVSAVILAPPALLIFRWWYGIFGMHFPI